MVAHACGEADLNAVRNTLQSKDLEQGHRSPGATLLNAEFQRLLDEPPDSAGKGLP